MKTTRSIGFGVVALATAGMGLQAEVPADKYAPLRAALAGKQQVAIAGAEDARFWVEEYDKILNDDETATDEKMALRKTHILEQARARTLSQEAALIGAAIRSLRGMPTQSTPTLGQLREAYDGLGDLGAQGRSAWDQLLSDRAASVEALKKEFAEELVEAEARHADLNTLERANRLLLDAINNRRLEASDVEFQVALKLPAIKSAVELGFGISNKPDDLDAQAQTTLIALVGYSQFFWDHYSGVRTELPEGGLPADRKRNIFGVADGEILKSEAIEQNERKFYYLSNSAREEFNGRIRAIWGTEGSIEVSRWDQDRAADFSRACQGLATLADEALLPNQHLFDLLEEIDTLIKQQAEAARVIRDVHNRYEALLAEASELGDRAALSSAHYNAEIWAKNSKQAIASFEAAQQLLDQELAASAEEEWTPNPRAIAASAQIIGREHSRFHSVVEVKKELAVLLR